MVVVEEIDEDQTSTSVEYASQAEYNTAVIYSNDNIMEQVLQYVYRFQERLKMEVVSKRFRKLLAQSGIVAPNVHYETLSLTIPDNSVRLTAHFGSYHSYLNCLTYDSFRRLKPNDPARLCQPVELMDILRKLLFAKDNVKNVVYGGRARDNYYTEGGAYEDLMLTRDLFEHLENFRNLRTLKLDDSHIDQQSIDYLKSEKCKFKYQIESLFILSMAQDTWILNLMHESLRNLTVRRLQLNKAEMLLKRIDELNLHLDTMNFEISNCDSFFEARDLMCKLSNRCKKLYLTFSSSDHKPGANLLLLARSIDNWTNITSLTLCSRSHSIRDAVDMSAIFEKLAFLTKLERLTISENIQTSLLIFLKRGIQDLENLKFLNFSDRAIQKERGVLKEFMGNLPLSLEEIKFDGIMWEHDALEVFCERLAPSLKRLTVTRPRHTSSSKLFEKLAQNFLNLEKFHFYNTVPWQYVSYVLNMPKLDDLSMYTSNGCPPQVEVVLQDNFETFYKTATCDDHHLECKKRKSSTLKLPLYPIRKNNNNSRKKKVEKMEW